MAFWRRNWDEHALSVPIRMVEPGIRLHSGAIIRLGDVFMTFRLLSCDGGGIRGYISSALIKKLNDATDGALLSKVDGFAGTSTGGLIALSLSVDVPIEQVFNIYANDAATIFTENSLFRSNAAQRAALEAQDLRSGPGLFECQYVATGLKQVIAKFVQAKTFGEVTGKMVAVNSARLLDDSANPPRWMPATLNNRNVGGNYTDIQLLDAALATSAAPTYFPPHLIDGMGYFADGGTFANNPVLNGIEVALSGGLASGLNDIEVVSIGTGLTPQGLSSKAIGDPLDWGVYDWLKPWKSDAGAPATPLLNLTMELSASNAFNVVERLLGSRIARINPTLTTSVPLDGYTAADYATMDAAIAQAMQSQGWKDAVKLIKGW